MKHSIFDLVSALYDDRVPKFGGWVNISRGTGRGMGRFLLRSTLYMIKRPKGKLVLANGAY